MLLVQGKETEWQHVTVSLILFVLTIGSFFFFPFLDRWAELE